MNNRLSWLDIAKAIGIVLVVIAHSTPESFVKMWIYSFHMPLFFFMSGVFINFNYIKNENTDVFAIKKTKSIFIPYIYFGIINTVLLIPVWGFTITLESIKYVGISGGPTWFLLSLFISEVFIYVLLKRFKNGILFFMLISFSLIIGYVLSNNDILIALYLSNIFVSIFFVGLGFVFGNLLFDINTKISSNNHSPFILYIIFIVFILSLLLNYYIVSKTETRLDIIENKLGEPFTMLSGALTGIICILSVSILLSFIKINFLQKALLYLGKNTLIIFALHMIFSLNYTVYAKPLFSSSILYISSKFLITWLAMFLFIYLINNYAPWLVGKKSNK